MDYYELIMKNLNNKKVSLVVRKDILSRCFDWFDMDGEVTDNYIKMQFDYLMRVINK